MPWKVWYVAPHFRYERPQKGRFRQHFQVGAEALGVDDPQLDVEVIALAHGFYRALGLRDFTLSINSMGDDADRAALRRAAARRTCSQHGDALGDTFRERVAANPLRVLDSKDPDWQDVIEHAPQITECLGDARPHALRGGAARPRPARDRARDQPAARPRARLLHEHHVRVRSQALDAAQNGIGGGGRYDGLVEQMGGKPTPGIGFGIGIERVLIACAAEGVVPGAEPTADVFVVDGMDNATEVTLLVTELREDGMRAERTYGGRSFKAQMKVADRSGARFTVLLGKQEAEHGAVGGEGHAVGRSGRGAAAAGRGLVAGTTRDRGHRQR